MGQTLRIHSPYLTYAFTSVYHVYYVCQPYTVSRMNYTISMAIRTPRSKYKLCDQNTGHISRMAIGLIRIHYVLNKLHYVPSSTVRTKRTVREQSEKLPFGYKSRQISHSSPHFLITLKNDIHVDQRNRNDCSRHGASSMCSSSLLEIEEEEKKKQKKKQKESRRHVQVKRRKKM